MPTKKPSGGVYLLRIQESERDIWRRARSRSVLEGKPIRQIIIELLDQWAYEGGFVERSKRRKRKA